jgi:hypothetical protein
MGDQRHENDMSVGLIESQNPQADADIPEGCNPSDAVPGAEEVFGLDEKFSGFASAGCVRTTKIPNNPYTEHSSPLK